MIFLIFIIYLKLVLHINKKTRLYLFNISTRLTCKPSIFHTCQMYEILGSNSTYKLGACVINMWQLHLELRYSRVAFPFVSTYSQEPTLIFLMSNHFHRLRIKTSALSYQSNSRSCVGPTRVRVKVQNLIRYLPCSAWTRVNIVRSLVPDEVAHGCFGFDLQ